MNENILKIKGLTDYLNKCRDTYLSTGEKIITDDKFNELLDELQHLEVVNNYYENISPNIQSGYEVKDNLDQSIHEIPLSLLPKTKSLNKIQEFLFKAPALLMMKYDGVTVELLYRNGHLAHASTKGDGKVGEDITHNAKTFINIPRYIPYKKELKLIGEAIILKNDFQTDNETLKNDVVESIRQLDSEICAHNKVYWMFGDVLEGFNNITNKATKFQLCRDLGFEIDFIQLTGYDRLYLEGRIQSLKTRAEDLNIPIDGMIFKYTDNNLSIVYEF